MLFSISFVVLGIFPGIDIWLSARLGFISASNFVFLYVISFLIVRVFNISLRLSRQEERLDSLVQSIALRLKE